MRARAHSPSLRAADVSPYVCLEVVRRCQGQERKVGLEG